MTNGTPLFGTRGVKVLIPFFRPFSVCYAKAPLIQLGLVLTNVAMEQARLGVSTLIWEPFDDISR